MMSQMQSAVPTMDQKMMAEMQVCSADQTFAAMMLLHHQSAADMSRIAPRSIKDPELRRIAEKTLKENEQGFAEMGAWQKKDP